MPQVIGLALLALACLALGLVLAAWLRWLFLKARSGCFPCLVVEGDGAARRERIGLAVFAAPELVWFARNPYGPRAVRRWPRQGLTIKARLSDDAGPAGWQVVQLRSAGTSDLLVLSRDAQSGLLSWIEAGSTRGEALGAS
ncbi:MAG: DUF2550 family protein [Bifidobacteriaceae bacterium]|jgi:hypothetical protein|nr:DUF2550 family protein [Bifidobacteriaceae bacterium]